MIQIAHTEQDKMQAYKLRHEIYIEELGRQFLSTSTRQYIKDERDKDATLLVAKNTEHRIIGTLRVHISTWSPYLLHKFGIEFKANHITYAVVDNFVLNEDYRNTKLGLRFMLEVFKFGINKGTDLCLIESAPELLNLYIKLGFTKYRIVNKKGVLRHQLYIEPFDLIHLKYSRSIFYPIMKSHHIKVYA